MKPCKIDFESLPWEQPAAGVRFKVYQQGVQQLRLLELSEGFVEPDWCCKGHVGYVLDGEFEIEFVGRTEIFRAGDGLFIPPGESQKHKARVTSKTIRVILVESL